LDNIFRRLGELRLIPVITIPDAKFASELARILTRVGLPCAEITFRTSAAEESIKVIAKSFPEMILGAGTVINIEQAKRAMNAGATYIVSPGFSHSVVKWCLENKLTVMPGITTSSEIMAGLDYGLGVLKFFPAEISGGEEMLKAFYGPFKEVKFVPTGGINPDNLNHYLVQPNVLAIGGSWFVKEKLIADQKFDEIERLTKEALVAIHNV